MWSFLRHAEAHGLIVRELISDNRWHRVPTTDKPRKKNGAYIFDGRRGAVMNWATMTKPAPFLGGQEPPLPKLRLRELAESAEREKKILQERAAQTAAEMLSRAVLTTHPYLASKGFPNEVGFVLDGELLVPMRDVRDYTKLWGVQRITTESKKFLYGSRTKGCVFRMGVASGATQRWVCEGYATGLSIFAALKDMRVNGQVFVCFSANNAAWCSQYIRKPAYFMADHDRSGVGAEAAKKSRLPWVMPPEVDMDANDYHQKQGLRSLIALMREVIR